MMKPKVFPSVWDDDEFQALPLEGRMTVFWLFTNGQVGLMGVYKRSNRRFTMDTGLEAAWIDRVMEAMPRFCKAWQAPDGQQWLFVRNFIRKQLNGDGPELVRNHIGKAVLVQLEGLGKGLRELVEDEYPVLADALGKGLARASEISRKSYGLQGLGKGLASGQKPEIAGGNGGSRAENGCENRASLESPSEGLGKGKGKGTGIGEGEGIGGGAGEPEIPSSVEVATVCGMDGVDPAYGERFWRQMTNGHGWVRNRRLVLWRNILSERWNEDRERWMAGALPGSPHKKNGPEKPGGGTPAWKRLKEMEEELRLHPGNPDGPEYRPGDDAAKGAFRAKREEFESLKKGGATNGRVEQVAKS